MRTLSRPLDICAGLLKSQSTAAQNGKMAGKAASFWNGCLVVGGLDEGGV